MKVDGNRRSIGRERVGTAVMTQLGARGEKCGTSCYGVITQERAACRSGYIAAFRVWTHLDRAVIIINYNKLQYMDH